MKKYVVIGLLLVVIAVIFFGCHDTGGGGEVVVSDTGQTTEAGPPTDATITATYETANHTGEDPTDFESSEAGNSPVSESTHESTEADTEATEPTSTEAKPSEPNPTEPKPTEPKPTNPAPTEPKPTEPKPTEPKPTEPAPTEPNPTNPVHTHSWSGWSQNKAPTCTANGEEVRTCSCGAKETRPVNALGHNWSTWSQTKAPTCGAEGTEGRSCSRCGVSESRSVPATGNHSWNETAPTCTEAGSKTCKVCGKTESGSAALGHDWVHHDEEGHWVPILTCYCGAQFYTYDEWHAHAFASPDLEYHDAHAGFECHEHWIVDNPAYDVCSRCGMTK